MVAERANTNCVHFLHTSEKFDIFVQRLLEGALHPHLIQPCMSLASYMHTFTRITRLLVLFFIITQIYEGMCILMQITQITAL